MWVDLHSHAAAKALYANPPDWNEMQAWKRILRPGDLFVDIGCNVGTYALWAADHGASVIAVEPSPDAVDLLRENFALNGVPVEIHPCALADRPGTMRLSQGRGTMNHLMLTPRTGGIDVRVNTLDQLLGDRHAAGVKIDVEGAERLVLEGAHRALAEGRIGVLQIEWNGMSQVVLGEGRGPAAEILRASGYRFCCPDEAGVLRPVHGSELMDDLFAVAPGSAALIVD